MTDSRATAQVGKGPIAERVTHVAHRTREPELSVVGYRDTGALLPSVLERVQAEVCHRRGILVTIDTKDSAFIVEFVAVWFSHHRSQFKACCHAADFSK